MRRGEDEGCDNRMTAVFEVLLEADGGVDIDEGEMAAVWGESVGLIEKVESKFGREHRKCMGQHVKRTGEARWSKRGAYSTCSRLVGARYCV